LGKDTQSSSILLLDRSCEPILSAINRYRQGWKLTDYNHIYATNTRLAHISQQPPAFEFPLNNLRNTAPQSVDFPYEKLTGQPMIYASLGSVQNTKEDVFRCIAAACEGLDVQLVIAHGGGMSADTARSLRGSPLVVEYAPQPDILAHASLTITHAGMNTILDSLSYGVPLIAIPITFEQPGNGARIRSTGVVKVLSLPRLSVSMLREAIARVLAENSYKINARKIQQSIQQTGGARQAADIIERVTRSQVSGVAKVA
jgi:MGT family glycosyltransferase